MALGESFTLLEVLATGAAGSCEMTASKRKERLLQNIKALSWRFEMSEEKTCPIWMTKRDGNKRPYRERCGAAATVYEVAGTAYIVRQELCPVHAAQAGTEGFKVSPVESSVEVCAKVRG